MDNKFKPIQLALAIGNSRYHWAWFLNAKLQASWDTEYVSIESLDRILPLDLQQLISDRQISLDLLPIYLVSVVNLETKKWQALPQVKSIALADVPLQNLYPTLGIDRALAALGAGSTYGYPVLVIDGGTALTLTGIDGERRLVGGAILPGLRLQLRSLAVGTSALPEIVLPDRLPPYWNSNTPEAIASGILHTVTAGLREFINNWRRSFPDSWVICTGGDGSLLVDYLQEYTLVNIQADRDLIFRGISTIIDLS